MAHVTKISAGGMRGLSTHVERKTDNHKNKMIDNSKTGQNYSLDNNENPMNYYQQRLGEVRVNQRRDDIKVAASWVITQPRDITPDESRKFFEAAHNFMAKRYGENNVVWSRVHMDETTPHLHFCFMPITPDKKHEGQEKLCAKDVLNRKELLKFHGDLGAEMSRVFGREIGIETGQTENNLELEKLKVKTALNEKEKELAEVTAKMKPHLAVQDLRDSLKKDAKPAWSLYEKTAVYTPAYNDVIKYLEAEHGKDKVIAELNNALKEEKNTTRNMQNRAEKAEQQRDFVYNDREKITAERNALQREYDAVKKEHKTVIAIIDAIKQIAPEILEKAIEFIQSRTRQAERGRGMSR